MTAKHKIILRTLSILLASSTMLGPLPAAVSATTVQQAPRHQSDFAESLNQMADAIAEQYPIEATAQKVANALRDGLASGTIETSDQDAFLKSTNKILWDTAHDLHLRLSTQEAIQKRVRRSGGKGVPTMRRVSRTAGSGPLGTTKIAGEMLNDTVGLITISSAIYRNPELFADALKLVRNANSIVIDLRGVPGGTVPGVRYFLSQFYNERTHLYSNVSRNFDEPREIWTEDTPVSENFNNTKLYILTSKRTASGAEAISFGLKNTGRATLIGEKTAGAGNGGAFLSVGSDLMLFLPTMQTISATTGKPWEGTGVVPHFEAAADDALTRALNVIEGGA